jgi:crossover junction endodeoxyribonuclease RusA
MEQNADSFTNESISIFIPFKPVPKGRPRMTRRGRVFTPQRTADAETLTRLAWGNNKKFDGPVSLVINFAPDGTLIVVCPYYGSDSKLRGDIDNYIKTIMDGLNGAAWDDDKQVMHVVAEKQ